MTFYKGLQSVADRLLGTKPLGGKAMTLKRRVSEVFDPVTGAPLGGADELIPELIPVLGIVSEFNLRLVDGTRILATDKRVVLTSAAEPLIADTLIIDGVDYQIVPPVRESKPTDTTLFYIVQARAV